VIGVDEDAAGDRVAHRLAIIDGVDEAVGHIVAPLDSTRQACEFGMVAVRRLFRRALQEVGEQFEDLADGPREPEKIRVVGWVVAVIPAGVASLCPGRGWRAELIATVEVVKPIPRDQVWRRGYAGHSEDSGGEKSGETHLNDLGL